MERFPDKEPANDVEVIQKQEVAQVALSIKHWLLRQLNANDSLDGVAVTVKLAVTEYGPKPVARELRKFADILERTGEVPGWKFPAPPPRLKRSRSQPADAVQPTSS
ncbi:MAG TPA: hypothetical protein VJQ50_07390 [Terriglobales bacterium]|nr:hypothetical protein [Terriglobales bacterium]